MHEGAPGSAYRTALRDGELPDDARFYGKGGSFEIYISRERQEIILGFSRHRPGNLYLPQSTINGISRIAKNGEGLNYHLQLAEEKEEMPDRYHEALPGTENWKIYRSGNGGQIVVSCRAQESNPGMLHLTVNDLEKMLDTL